MQDIFPAIAIAGVIFFVARTMWHGYNTQEMICTDCGTIGEGEERYKGSLAIEIILWLCFIVPGLIYSIWRSSSRTRVCSSCGGKLIGLDSPRGQQLYK